jgi:aminoglycoside phosphotransferase (APT) family kinase protein
MTIMRKPAAELAIDSDLVRALLCAQHPDLADLPLVEAGEGWDNQMYRLGDSLGVRLPRRMLAADLIVHEQRWLPALAARLPLPVPAPVRTGQPGGGFPWSWSIVPWFEGRSAAVTSANPISMAEDLGRFLRALHQAAPEEAPPNRWRGVPLATRTPSVLECLKQLGDRVPAARITRLWAESVSAVPWSGRPVWLHGDLHPGNLVVHRDRVAAVVDFGDLTSGDPATDLSVAWSTLPPAARPIFRAAARNAFDPIDDATWVRARGWALTLGLVFLANSFDDAQLEALGQSTIQAALDDDSSATTG